MKKIALLVFFVPLCVSAQVDDVSPCLHARIALVTDVSGSMKGLEKPLYGALSSFVTHLPIKRDRIEVGLLYFNDNAIWYDFDGDKKNLSQKIFLHSERECIGGTNILRTLSFLHTVFTDLNLSDTYLRIVIIITDGQFEEYQDEAVRISKSLKEELNVSIYIIHMGNVEQAEPLLKRMVGEGNYYGSYYTTLAKDIRRFGLCF